MSKIYQSILYQYIINPTDKLLLLIILLFISTLLTSEENNIDKININIDIINILNRLLLHLRHRLSFII